MAEQITEQSSSDVWFAYDGDCPICSRAAQYLRVKESVGRLHLVNARDNRDHPFIQEIKALGLNLDEGMVLKYRDVCYHGEDALHMMALLGSGTGWFNRMNAFLFRSKPIAKISYPVMRAARNILLRAIGVAKIQNLRDTHPLCDPIFKNIFGESWNALPAVMKDHYLVRPYSDDVVIVKGALDIKVSWFMSLMARITGMLVPYSGLGVPTTVTFRSGKNSEAFHFDRVFHFPDKGDIRFRSRMEWMGGNELVEFMGFGIGWRTAYEWNGDTVVLKHRGYIWRLLGVLVPLPLSLIIGKAWAEEKPVSETAFNMWTHIKHPLFGEALRYAGTFEIVEMSCKEQF